MHPTALANRRLLRDLVDRIVQAHPVATVVARGAEPERAFYSCVMRLAGALGVCVASGQEGGKGTFDVFRIAGGPEHVVAFEDSYRRGTGVTQGLSEAEVLHLLGCYAAMEASRAARAGEWTGATG